MAEKGLSPAIPTHGSIGVYYWLRLKKPFRTIAPVLFAVAVLLPILALLGFDHTKLTYRFQGRDFRLTDVHGKVVRELLA